MGWTKQACPRRSKMSFVGICDRFRGLETKHLETKPGCPRIMKMDLVGTVVWSRWVNVESSQARTSSDQTGVTKNLKIRHLCHLCPEYRTQNQTGMTKLSVNREFCHACPVPFGLPGSNTPPSPSEHAKSCAPLLNKPGKPESAGCAALKLQKTYAL